MNIEGTEKNNKSKNKGVWIRVLLARNTHRKLKTFNRSQPRETIGNSAGRLIEMALEPAQAPQT